MSDVRVAIVFDPDDGPEQTLYAYLPPKDLDALAAEVGKPERAEEVLVIDAALQPSGPYLQRVFRWGRIKSIKRATS
ncbi:hypothetical protein ACFY05_32010 [Microtetraspora fusca]|uniref:DUF2283 domain-containing protein n=1 Tax=Microtetraspora fusca TaxID=1997 RepID=A0ABW6VDV7_MICFU